MVFYVYFDPALIAEADREGQLGLSCLVGIVRSLEANCFLAEFDDWHVQGEIKENVKQLEEKLRTMGISERADLADFVKRLKSLFGTLIKRNRFVYCLKSTGEITELRVATVLAQGKKAELDLVLAVNPGANPNPDKLATATLRSYSTTDFEARRSHVAANGILCPPDEMREEDFLNRTLRKVLKHASTIHLYDKVMGNQWGDNFEHTVKTLLFWLETFLPEPTKTEFHLYCGKPAGFVDQHMKGQLNSFRRGRLAGMPITIHFHETLAGADTMPHDRFVVTDQIAIEIGRGMDFLDRRTRRNRDASVNLKDLTELGEFLKKVSSSSLAPVCC